MIGYVLGRHEDGRAILMEDGRWRFDGHPEARGQLRFAAASLDPGDEGPASGPFGHARLHALAERVGGEVHIARKARHPEGTIF
jgi:hypothetical protein